MKMGIVTRVIARKPIYISRAWVSMLNRRRDRKRYFRISNLVIFQKFKNTTQFVYGVHVGITTTNVLSALDKVNVL